jgi:protocatechuate 3,4-dioxygenase beta subunit
MHTTCTCALPAIILAAATDYGGRPHIHIRVTAPGFQELFTHHYPQHGTGHGTFDLTLSPTPRQETPTNR